MDRRKLLQFVSKQNFHNAMFDIYSFCNHGVNQIFNCSEIFCLIDFFTADLNSWRWFFTKYNIELSQFLPNEI